MADTIIENLITRFGFEFDQKTLDKIDSGIGGAVKGLLKIVAAAGAAGAAIFFFTQKIAASNDELGKFSERIGVDLAALQELGFVAELNGGSIESMNSSLSNLSKTMSAASRGTGAGIEAFGILGLSVTDMEGRLKSADDFLFEVSDSLSRLRTQAEKLELAGKLGIDESLLLSLDKGSAALREQREEAKELGFIIDQNATKAAANFNDEMLRAQKIVSGVSNAIGRRLMKQITPMVKAFVSWFKVNKELIKQNVVAFLDKTVKILGALFNVAIRVINVIVGITNGLGGLQNVLLGVGTAFLLLNAKALILPVVFAAASVALFLLLEDLQKFIEGGDSAFGAFEKRLDGILGLGRRENFWKDFFANPEKVFTDAWRDIKFIFKAEWFNITETMFRATILVSRFFEKTWKNSLNFIKNKIKELFGLIPTLDEGTADALGGGIGVPPVPVFGSESLLDRSLDNNLSISNKSTSQVTSNSNSDNRVVNITVNGGDLAEIKRVMDETLNNNYSAAKKNLTSDVVY